MEQKIRKMMKASRVVKQLKQIEKLVNKAENGRNLRLAAEWKIKWQILISTILSSQTRDEMTIKISNELYKKFPSLKKLANAKLASIERIIRPLNYYKTKARHIHETAKILIQKYKGKI